jgi:hypothetical protein
VENTKPGTTIEFTVARKEELLKIEVQVGKLEIE